MPPYPGSYWIIGSGSESGSGCSKFASNITFAVPSSLPRPCDRIRAAPSSRAPAETLTPLVSLSAYLRKAYNFPTARALLRSTFAALNPSKNPRATAMGAEAKLDSVERREEGDVGVEKEGEEEKSFEELGLDEQLTRALRKKSVTDPTPIQRAAIPLILVINPYLVASWIAFALVSYAFF